MRVNTPLSGAPYTSAWFVCHVMPAPNADVGFGKSMSALTPVTLIDVDVNVLDASVPLNVPVAPVMLAPDNEPVNVPVAPLNVPLNVPVAAVSEPANVPLAADNAPLNVAEPSERNANDGCCKNGLDPVAFKSR